VTRWLRRLAGALRDRNVEAAYVFGSCARGEADAWSDIDLIVVAPSERPFVDRFRDYPELLDAPTGVDLLVFTPEEFARERRCNRFVRHVLRDARRIV
jgi:predicted nucleotidyltransferase